MKKTLIYHLYLNEDIDNNIIYDIHHKCLKFYINIFDNVKFNISVNNLKDKKLIKKGINWVLDINNGVPFAIKIVQNDEYREAKTFYNEIYNNSEDEGIIYWAHSKGVSNIYDNKFNVNSIINWICTMYFYNFEFVKNIEDIFLNSKQCLYGTLLLVPNDEDCGVRQHYAGGCYWINIDSLNNYKTSGIIKNLKLSNRYLGEDFPGLFFKRDTYASGLHSYKDKALIQEIFCEKLYMGNHDDWMEIINILGESERYWDFYNNIIK